MSRLAFISITALVGLVLVGCSAAPASQVPSSSAQSVLPDAPADSPVEAAVTTPSADAPAEVAMNTEPEASHTAVPSFAGKSAPTDPVSGPATAAVEVDCSLSQNRCNPACGAGLAQSRLFIASVDDSAYSFTLPSASGQDVSLKSFRGDKNILLVVNRDLWCESCRDQLMDLTARYSEIQGMDTEVLAISIDDLFDSQDIVDSMGIPFPVLYDSDILMVADYGIFNLFGDGRPASSNFLIDKEGVIRWVYAAEEVDDQASIEEIMRQLALIQG